MILVDIIYGGNFSDGIGRGKIFDLEGVVGMFDEF